MSVCLFLFSFFPLHAASAVRKKHKLVISLHNTLLQGASAKKTFPAFFVLQILKFTVKFSTYLILTSGMLFRELSSYLYPARKKQNTNV